MDTELKKKYDYLCLIYCTHMSNYWDVSKIFLFLRRLIGHNTKKPNQSTLHF